MKQSVTGGALPPPVIPLTGLTAAGVPLAFGPTVGTIVIFPVAPDVQEDVAFWISVRHEIEVESIGFVGVCVSDVCAHEDGLRATEPHQVVIVTYPSVLLALTVFQDAAAGRFALCDTSGSVWARGIRTKVPEDAAAFILREVRSRG